MVLWNSNGTLDITYISSDLQRVPFINEKYYINCFKKDFYVLLFIPITYSYNSKTSQMTHVENLSLKIL